ncbi:MAG TPA: glycosyltransferase family 39 protein [Bryobacteraceae bacterium]|nr:glycosyltransferase family 39 protein [Bryobacteraceae bacterium]
MPIRWRVALIWACFLVRLAFYATMLPLWEGYDEWAHLAVIRTMAFDRVALVPRDQPVPRDVAQSLAIAPVPWDLRDLPPPSVTEDAYWSMPIDARAQRETAFRALPKGADRNDQAAGLTAYEALQAPLYYWLMAPPMRLMSAASLAAQVLAIRWLSIAIASSIIPLIFLVARATFEDDRLALCCIAAVALMPGLAFDVARVGNECLAMVWFSLLIWLGLREEMSWRAYVAAGVTLGLGLLTKAYFLTAVPAVLLLPFFRREKTRKWRGLVPAGIALAISGWWFVRNLRTTGALSGLSEAVMLHNTGMVSMLRETAHVPWGTAVDAILLSHLYFGGWSGLTVRSWMYHAFYGLILLSGFGLLRMLRRPRVPWLLVVYAGFWAGQAYNVVLLYMTKGLPGSMGWYLYAVIGAQAALCAGGLARIRAWVPGVAVAMFGVLDLYTVHGVAIPYYTGLIRHKPGGAVAALHLADARLIGVQGVIDRLLAFKPAGMSESLLIAAWFAYLAATIYLIATPWSKSPTE